MRRNWSLKWLASGAVGMSLLVGGCGPSEEKAPETTSTAPAEATAGDLQVRLSLGHTSFRADEQVLVTATLTNVGSEPVKLLRWLVPGDEHIDGEVFHLFLDGKEVEFVGRHYKRAAPQPSDYIHLAPGESFTGSAELSDMFDLTRSGTYSIRYAPGEHGADPLQRVSQLESNEVSLWIEGRPSSRPVVAAQGTVVAAALSTANCSSTRITALTSAFDSAKQYATNSHNYFNNQTPGSYPRYQTWFGVYSLTAWNQLKNHFYNVKDALYNRSVVVDCNCTDSAFAYVYKNQPYRIWVCNAFWNAATVGTDSRAGTLVHELSHFTVVADTDDWAYGHTSCKSLAKTDPAKARDNADSHEYFSENSPYQN